MITILADFQFLTYRKPLFFPIIKDEQMTIYRHLVALCVCNYIDAYEFICRTFLEQTVSLVFK